MSVNGLIVEEVQDKVNSSGKTRGRHLSLYSPSRRRHSAIFGDENQLYNLGRDSQVGCFVGEWEGCQREHRKQLLLGLSRRLLISYRTQPFSIEGCIQQNGHVCLDKTS